MMIAIRVGTCGSSGQRRARHRSGRSRPYGRFVKLILCLLTDPRELGLPADTTPNRTVPAGQ
jgi:hypothetical protein